MSALPKVKPADEKRLAKLGIETIRDLLLTLPFDWETYGAPAEVSRLTPGRQATVIGTITAISAKQSLRKRIRVPHLDKKTGATLFHEVRYTSNSRCYDRDPGGHRLCDHQRAGLLRRGEYENGCSLVFRKQSFCRQRTEQLDPIFEPKSAYACG